MLARSCDASSVVLDDVNLAILDLLSHQGRAPAAAVAQAIGRPEGTVRDRVAAMEARGILRGYGARIDWGLVGLPLVVMVDGHCLPGHQEAVGVALARIRGLTHAYLTTGPSNVAATIRAADMGHVAADLAALEASGLGSLQVRMTIEGLVAERSVVPALREPGDLRSHVAGARHAA